jgi:hypothetical protein
MVPGGLQAIIVKYMRFIPIDCRFQNPRFYVNSTIPAVPVGCLGAFQERGQHGGQVAREKGLWGLAAAKALPNPTYTHPLAAAAPQGGMHSGCLITQKEDGYGTG